MLVLKVLRSATGQVPPTRLVSASAQYDRLGLGLGATTAEPRPSVRFFIKLRLSIIVSYNSQFLNKCTCVPKEDQPTKTLDRTLSQLRENPIQ